MVDCVSEVAIPVDEEMRAEAQQEKSGMFNPFKRQSYHEAMRGSDMNTHLKTEGVAGTTEPLPFVVKELQQKAQLFLERNKLYGDNYKRFGMILSLVLQGQEIDAEDPEQMNRLGILVQIVSKVTRYGENFAKGGHDDSLDDIAVYAMMLKELDHG